MDNLLYTFPVTKCNAPGRLRFVHFLAIGFKSLSASKQSESGRKATLPNLQMFSNCFFNSALDENKISLSK